MLVASHSLPDKPLNTTKWTVDKIRDLTLRRFGKRPCWFQIEVARALYGGKDVVGVAGTGAGKTLSFWIALMMAIDDGRPDALVVVVTPLNLLGHQNKTVLHAAGISAVAVDQATLVEDGHLRKSTRVAIMLLPSPLSSSHHQPCKKY
jgi:superfamily II DNA helicase RecQ